ncbi:MAG: CocE/NonD family hydrolase [Lachnospiraceae bacterium]|nr:CocE/NonD family hydrolase [Lachnospiraceae bacterium]
MQPGPDYREDVVSFCSRPLKESITVLGKIRVNLDVGTDAEDTAFVVKVMEVMEDGKAYNIRTGITTLGYRGGSKKRQTYTPHTIVPISIEMWDVAWKIQKNSRLRIDITSSDFPQYCVHSNYAGCWAQARQNKDACQKIYFGKGHSSSVVFPKLETDGSRVGD